jgi:hypothetical protein
VIPERGLYTGIAILGAVGSGKTSCCMYPFANQILGYQSHDRAKRIGALMLEVKGDFCHQIRRILKRYKREEDYIEIGLDSGYCYNPLHNDLDAYGLAYSIASLLNNLFGKGKEPFWQQAYTNLVKLSFCSTKPLSITSRFSMSTTVRYLQTFWRRESKKRNRCFSIGILW